MATHSTFNTHSVTNGNGGVVADHTHSSDLDSLMDKVNMNTAFTNLARNDAMLVNEMKNGGWSRANEERKRMWTKLWDLFGPEGSREGYASQ